MSARSRRALFPGGPETMRRRRSGQQHYRFTIPERDQVLAFLEEAARPRRLDHIAEALGVHGEERVAALEKRLEAMVRDGQLVRNRREGYGLVEKMNLVVGRVHGHADGYGFLIPEQPDAAGDIFLPAREMRKVLHEDRVVVRVSGYDRRGRREGAVVKVLEHANTQVVGRFFRE